MRRPRIVTSVLFLLPIACGQDAGPADGNVSGSVGSAGDATQTAGTSPGEHDGTSTTTGAGSASTSAHNDDTTSTTDGEGAETDGTTTGDASSGGRSGSDSSGGASSSGSSGEGPLSDDPFDPAACNGVPWSAEDAGAQLGGLPREVLANATIQVRTRTCNGEACDPWGPGEDWVISYLTWSGGVVTAYTELEASMNLVLFDDDGLARLSMQHETFAVGGYPDDDGVLYDFPPQVVSYPHLRAYNVDPEFEYDYIDLDYQVAQGEMVLGDGCAVWTANPFGTGQPYTAQYGAVFHW